jgi:hypothetical protein
VVCLAKDPAKIVARTRTTKHYVTLDSLFFSYSLELEEAFHQQRSCSLQDFRKSSISKHTFSGATVNFSNWVNTIISYNSPGRIAAVPQ